MISKEKNEQVFILGGGSNILITKNFDGIIEFKLRAKN